MIKLEKKDIFPQKKTESPLKESMRCEMVSLVPFKFYKYFFAIFAKLQLNKMYMLAFFSG